MLPELVVALVVVTPDCRILDGPVHPLDLTIRPGMPGCGQAMLDIEAGTGEFEAVRPAELAARNRLFDERRSRSLVAGRGEGRAVVGEHRVNLVGNSRDQAPEEVACHALRDLLVQLHDGELTRAIDGD